MHALIDQLGAFISDNRMWAAPLLGLLTFLESLAFIGGFFPATAVMVVAGGLIAAGVLDPLPVLAWCVVGAVLGDAVSYSIGRRIGPGAWRHPRLKPHRRHAARGRLFFRKYGSASIYLCRFLGPVRAFVPLIAGITRMSQRRFQTANVGSALVWVPVMVAPGWLAGKGVQGAAAVGHIEHVLMIVAAAAALTAAAWFAWRRLKPRAAEVAGPRAR